MFSAKKAIVLYLIVALSLIQVHAFGQHSTQHPAKQITDAEAQEVRELAQRFTHRFLETYDLAPITQELFVSNFMERFRNARAGNRDAPEVYFVPGLFVHSRLFKDAKAEDWEQLYIAAQNFIFFGLLSVLKNMPKDIDNLKPSEMYPRSVIKLLESDPNLSDMVEKKNTAHPVGSVEEMRHATAKLKEANEIMRPLFQSKPAPKMDNKTLTDLMKSDETFKPQVDVSDEEGLGFPKDTRVFLITTPLLFQLMMVRVDGKLKIVWATPYLGD